jgi:hypothetical protein
MIGAPGGICTDEPAIVLHVFERSNPELITSRLHNLAATQVINRCQHVTKNDTFRHFLVSPRSTGFCRSLGQLKTRITTGERRMCVGQALVTAPDCHERDTVLAAVKEWPPGTELVELVHRRPSLTAAPLGVPLHAQVGTKKRSLGRTKKQTQGMKVAEHLPVDGGLLASGNRR